MGLSTLPREIGAIRSLMDKGKRPERKIVFYSESAIYYLYYESFIEHLLNDSYETITYITSDPGDPVIDKASQRFRVYYISNAMMAFTTGLLDADNLVFTMTDLGNYHIRRSTKDVNHIYIFHAIMSTHMIYSKEAFDHYDAIFCVGPYQVKEIRAREKHYGLRKKALIEVGYPLLEKLHAEHMQERVKKNVKDKPVLLVAPTWSEGNLFEICMDELIERLLAASFTVVLRPHPETYKRNRSSINQIIAKYRYQENFELETALTSVANFHRADLLITDWSGIALEYAFGTERPVLFINTPQKIHNREYEKIGLEPIEVSLRGKIGRQVEPDEISSIAAAVKEVLANGLYYQDEIISAREENIFNWGRSTEIGGQYLLHSLAEKSRKIEKI